MLKSQAVHAVQCSHNFCPNIFNTLFTRRLFRQRVCVQNMKMTQLEATFSKYDRIAFEFICFSPLIVNSSIRSLP